MSTVVLRGTLHYRRDDDDNNKNNNIAKAATTGGGVGGEWQWKGLWAFGNSLSTVPVQSQRPFVYTFQGATNPEEIEIPGILVEMEEREEEQQQQDVVCSNSATIGDNTRGGHGEGEAINQSENMSETSKSLVEPSRQHLETGIKETPQSTSEAFTVESDQNPLANKAHPSDDTTTETTENKSAKEEMDMEINRAEKDSYKEMSNGDPETRPPTFALVPEGHPPFTDACIKYPDVPCPPSGQWKGHFQNFINARPREKIENVQENFYLFFNATAGPDVTFAFDDTPLPPGVQKENLVLVRGTGSNPFGTFELIGYLDLKAGVIEIQRQYVLMPVKRRNRRSTTTGNSTKPYSTRKRQPSWKRKSLEDGEDGPAPKRQRRQAKTIETPSNAATITGVGVGLASNGGPSAVPPSAATVPDRTQSISGMPPVTATEIATPLPDQTDFRIKMDPPPNQSSGTGSGTKKSKTPRKRSGSVGSIKSTTSSISVTPSTQHMKLPPVGEPKKARWRAAHFLYYQRNDPEDEEVKTPKYVVYEGEMANSMREGRGICLFSNGLLYEGQWKRNKEHGLGQLWTADRRRLIYDGNWERGRMQGHGTYYYGNGKSTVATGVSNSHLSGGARYIGEFKENMRHGLGHYILRDGSEYHGMWVQGKMNGRGVFTWPDLSVYDGDFKDGERHGQGLLKTSDGFSYDGTWVQNAMEGRGIARYPNGQSFEGLFSNGRREGRGTMRFTNGAIYEGRFRDDAVDGQGTMKISRSLVVPSSQHDGEDMPSNSDEDPNQSTPKRPDFMIPISFQSDMTHIHAKAGFTAIGD